MGPRTDLEQVVLGVVWKKGPVTAHGVRVEFSRSRTEHWSGSAGAIYPLMSRLEEAGLLRSSIDRQQARDRKMYRITTKGLRQLRRWLTPPLSDTAFSTQFDPLRTRVFFLGSLEPAEQRKFLDDAEQALQRQWAEHRDDRNDYRKKNRPFSAMAEEGAMATCRARITWIRSLRKKI